MGSMLKVIFNLSSHPQLGRSENERESTDLIKSQVFPYFAPRRLENIFYVTESSQNNKKTLISVLRSCLRKEQVIKFGFQEAGICVTHSSTFMLLVLSMISSTTHTDH